MSHGPRCHVMGRAGPGWQAHQRRPMTSPEILGVYDGTRKTRPKKKKNVVRRIRTPIVPTCQACDDHPSYLVRSRCRWYISACGYYILIKVSDKRLFFVKIYSTKPSSWLDLNTHISLIAIDQDNWFRRPFIIGKCAGKCFWNYILRGTI